MANRFLSYLLQATLLVGLITGCKTETDKVITPEPVSTAPEADGSGVTATSSTTATVTFSTQQLELLGYINNLRSKPCQCGTTTYPAAAPLQLNALLNEASRKHAADMANYNYFSHTGRDGSKPWDRMSREGYVWRYAGENIAAGNATVLATFNQWRNSPGHCANMMSANFKEVGLGYAYSAASTYKHYWVTDFGTR
ncbi:CAP domain-containing protein [Tellurirhabdus rosea]|uniref:CAP domain-containing protein n=1 Tax=Tellurirhabdus rosea TaxID=2674997 RepID=UPI00224C99C7|nr:CAP domain-containing protein [Tellurirhabdus rosea]